MRLYEELKINLKKNEMICFVGAGGKSSSMFILAKELKDLGKSVLVTTTTSIFEPKENEYDEFIVESKYEDIVNNKISKGTITILGSEIKETGKLKGLNKEVISKIYDDKVYDFILVEGDGSRRKPIKAPAHHEPVIPERCDRILGVIGLDSVGKLIDESHVHRPEIFCEFTGYEMKDKIDELAISNLIKHENGLFKNTPESCEKYLLLNKADDDIRMKYGLNIKNILIDNNISINNIIIGSMKKNKYYNNNIKITGIILASGLSKRMGKEKLLLNIDGIPIIERVIRSVKGSKIDDIILVYKNDEIKEIGKKYNIKTVLNENSNLGQSESIKLGLKNSYSFTDGYMFFVGDQPYLDSYIINKIIDKYDNENSKIIIPRYNNKNGNPVLFSSKLKDKLLDLKGDTGGRKIINETNEVDYIDFKDERLGIDIDTIEEYDEYK